ncbi:MAG: GGDEF domain-containing protein [Acidobacteria bacterium]|nr:GGDEF domain-containing protein [Acidobacteriota bacterium]
MDARILALVAGLTGAALAFGAAVTGEPVLAVLAGVAALLAGVIPALAGRDGRDRHADQSGWEVATQLAAATRDLEATRARVTDLETEIESLTASVARVDDAERVALTDPATELFSEAYFHVALESRLAAARRHLRPVAVALLRSVEGPAGDTVVAPPPTRLADAIRETIRDADIACRLDDGTFAVILEDTPENGAVWTAERIRRNLVSRHGSHTVWAGIACYPAHAFSSDELFRQASTALAAAQDWQQDRIEVAVSE